MTFPPKNAHDHETTTDHHCDDTCLHHRRPAPAGQGWGEATADHLGYRRDELAKRFPYLAALLERVLIYDGGCGTELFKF